MGEKIDKTTERIIKKTKELRKDMGITMVELGEQAGLSRQGIYQIESGKFSPSVSTLSRILEPMGYTLDIVPIVQGEMNPALNSLARALEGLGYKIVPVENTEGNEE